MTTTELYSGHTGKSSSRVLQPPGGGSSNIFGGSDDRETRPARAVQQEQQTAGQGEPSGAAAMQQQQQSQAQQQQQQGGQKKYKNRDTSDPAPFATFSESGKKSHPSQFDACNTESQNDADFRCHSVTAYRDAIATNAAVRQRARGAATGTFNPITHEESADNSNPYQSYEQTRVHPQQVQNQMVDQVKPGRRAQPNNRARGAYNPITGEEYPDTYGNEEDDEENKEEEETAENENDQDKPADTSGSTNEQKPAQPTSPAQTDSNAFLVKKVRQPPGGASSGLW